MRQKQSHPKSAKDYGRYRAYTQETLQKALAYVQTEKVSVRRAAKQFNVPVQTLRDRVKGRIDPFNLGNEVTLFSYEEELSLVEHIEVLAQLGYGITNNKLKDLWGEFLFVLAVWISTLLILFEYKTFSD